MFISDSNEDAQAEEDKVINYLALRLNRERGRVLDRASDAHRIGDRALRQRYLTFAQTLGVSVADVGRALGVTRQRAHQLMPR